MTKLWQNIDTLKFHLYPTVEMSVDDIKTYNNYITELINIKRLASDNKNKYKEYKNYKTKKNYEFQVMPSTVRGFSVSLQNKDVTIHLKKITLVNVNNPFSKIEFRAQFLHQHGYIKAIQRVLDVVNIDIIKNYEIKISEIHLQCDIQGYNFSNLDFYRFKTRSRNVSLYTEDNSDRIYFNGRDFQGLSFGSGDYMMRIYNKTNEIKKFPNKNYIKHFWQQNKDFDEMKDVFRIEFQLRREKLKNMSINGNRLDGFEIILNNINNIWQKCLNDFNMLDIDNNKAIEHYVGYRTLKNGSISIVTKNLIKKRFQDADIHPLWQLIQTFNGHWKNDDIETYLKPNSDNFLYVANSYKSFLSTMLNHYNTLNPKTVIDSIQRIEYENELNKECTTLESVLSNKLDRFVELQVNDIHYKKMQKDKQHFSNCVQEIMYGKFLDFAKTDLTDSFMERMHKKGMIA